MTRPDPTRPVPGRLGARGPAYAVAAGPCMQASIDLPTKPETRFAKRRRIRNVDSPRNASCQPFFPSLPTIRRTDGRRYQTEQLQDVDGSKAESMSSSLSRDSSAKRVIIDDRTPNDEMAANRSLLHDCRDRSRPKERRTRRRASEHGKVRVRRQADLRLATETPCGEDQRPGVHSRRRPDVQLTATVPPTTPCAAKPSILLAVGGRYACARAVGPHAVSQSVRQAVDRSLVDGAACTEFECGCCSNALRFSPSSLREYSGSGTTSGQFDVCIRTLRWLRRSWLFSKDYNALHNFILFQLCL